MAADFSMNFGAKPHAAFGQAERLARQPEKLRQRFWSAFTRVAGKLPFAEDILAAYYCAFDRQTPRHVQAALLGALAYFVLPFDIAPDVLPLLGFTDDAAVLATAIRMVSSHITPDHRKAAQNVLARGGAKPNPNRKPKPAAGDDAPQG